MRAVRTTHRRRTEQGQSLVEFGLTGILLLVLVVGIGQLGFMLYAFVTVDTAARDGARVAAEHPNQSEAFQGSPAATQVQCSGTASTGGAAASPNNPACVAVAKSSGLFSGHTTTWGCPAFSGSGCTTIQSNYWPPQCSGGSCDTTLASACSLGWVPDGYVEVTVLYRVPIVIPLLTQMLSDPGTNYRTVSATVTERVDPCTMTAGS
jgi:Flp pilus assembly protein TadG